MTGEKKGAMLKKLLDKSLLYFLLIGAGNTLLSMLIMFLLYEKAGFGYWGASATAFAVTSVLSFLLNKRLSFRYEGRVWAAALRFALVIAGCYLIAYSLAQPAAAWLMRRLGGGAFSAAAIDRVALVAGQVIFTGLNYFGQGFFAFRQGDSASRPFSGAPRR
jgi:putative flippase GtrA